MIAHTPWIMKFKTKSLFLHAVSDKSLSPIGFGVHKGCPFAPPTGPYLTASYTIEAALVMPVFLFVCVTVLFFMRICVTQWCIQTALNETVQSSAQFPGLEEEEKISAHKAMLISAANIRIRQKDTPMQWIAGGFLGLDFSQTEITGRKVILRVRYQMPIPVAGARQLLGRYGWQLSQQASARIWNGYDPAEEAAVEYVYMTKSGTVYHRSLSCPYLNPSIQSLTKSQLQTARNSSRHKYKSCPFCRSGASGSYYVTTYGTRWHKSVNCPALRRTIRRVQLQDVEGKKACGKCG